MTVHRPGEPFAIRTEADVLALVPFTLGFHPEDSLVLVTTSAAGRPFHARIDLPDEPGELPVVVDVIARAAVRNSDAGSSTLAMVVAYTDDECVAEAAAELIASDLEPAGFEVVMRIRADGRRWFPLGGGGSDDRACAGVPYDVRTHELTARAVVDGRVTFGSREELVESLAPLDPEAVEEVLAAHAVLPPLDVSRAALVQEAEWLRNQIRGHVAHGTVPGPSEIARILRAVRHRDVRDLAWCDVTREDAERHAELWRAVVRRSPEELVAAPAGLLAFTAWLSGNGALSWCAVDRSLCADPDHVLARLVGQALETAMPPTAWRPVDLTELALYAG